MQLALFKNGSLPKPVFMDGVDPMQCRLSRFNPRKTRDKDNVQALAKQMDAIGFKPDRALYAYTANDGFYEVFAGGNRLFAAQDIAKTQPFTIALWLCDEWDTATISRFAFEDNVSDGLHSVPRPADIWAEYARLKEIEGWTQKQIAKTLGVTESMVSMRLKWYTLPLNIKDMVGSSSSVLTEYHLQVIFTELQALELLRVWADLGTWRVNALTWAHDKKKSSRQLADYWQQRKDAVERANELIATIPEGDQDEYILDGDAIARRATDYQRAFVDALIDLDAQTVANVDRAFATVAQRVKASADRKAAYDSRQDADQQRQKEEQQRIEAIQSRWIHGDCLEAIPSLHDGSVRLLLTDPPYGVDFQSNRRVASGKEDKIENDKEAAALTIFDDMLDAVAPKLADEAHLLVFAHWRTEFEFRQMLEDRGYIIRGSLVWVKENHSSGDLDGAFAPQHERIIHATKGHPALHPRVSDVFTFARGTRTNHPTEKPVKLLKQLIACTTSPGDLVVDPFGGSASTLLAAAQTDRAWWGCELSDEWWSIAYKELTDAKIV